MVLPASGCEVAAVLVVSATGAADAAAEGFTLEAPSAGDVAPSPSSASPFPWNGFMAIFLAPRAI